MGIYSDVQSGLYNVVTKSLSYEYPTLPIIFAYQNGTEPSSTYATLNLLQLRQVGRGTISTLANTDETIDFGVVYEGDVQVSFYGSESGDAINSFIHNINNNPLVLEEIKVNNLGFMRKSQIRNNPQKRSTGWVDSFNMTITINYIVSTNEAVDVVEHVIFEIQDDGQQIVVPPFPTP